MKIDKNMIWILVIAVAVLFLIQSQSKEIKKEAGETVAVSNNLPVNLGGELRLTFTINSQTNVPLWKVKDIVVPSGWNYIDKEVTGASGLDHNELCSTQDDGKFGCNLFASPGSIVAKTLTLRYTAPSTASAATFSGNWETYYGDPGVLQNSQAWNQQVSFTRSCGSGGCVGTQTYITSWGTCSSNNNDCGICCKCSSTGTETYDASQNGDCSGSDCDDDGCGLGGCGTHIFADYPTSVSNQCQALKQCTSNTCTATCESDGDSDGYSSSCGDCNPTNGAIHPGATELCWSGFDEDCDSDQLIGSSEADTDCGQRTTWTELDTYITAWATGQQWDKPLPAHTITWTKLDSVITLWATGH